MDTSRRSSILKVRLRPPLQDVNFGGTADETEDMDVTRKRRVSFARANKIKEFHSKAESLNICNTPAYDETFSSSSDSSQLTASIEQSNLLGTTPTSQSLPPYFDQQSVLVDDSMDLTDPAFTDLAHIKEPMCLELGLNNPNPMSRIGVESTQVDASSSRPFSVLKCAKSLNPPPTISPFESFISPVSMDLTRAVCQVDMERTLCEEMDVTLQSNHQVPLTVETPVNIESSHRSFDSNNRFESQIEETEVLPQVFSEYRPQSTSTFNPFEEHKNIQRNCFLTKGLNEVEGKSEPFETSSLRSELAATGGFIQNLNDSCMEFTEAVGLNDFNKNSVLSHNILSNHGFSSELGALTDVNPIEHSTSKRLCESQMEETEVLPRVQYGKTIQSIPANINRFEELPKQRNCFSQTSTEGTQIKLNEIKVKPPRELNDENIPPFNRNDLMPDLTQMDKMVGSGLVQKLDNSNIDFTQGINVNTINKKKCLPNFIKHPSGNDDSNGNAMEITEALPLKIVEEKGRFLTQRFEMEDQNQKELPLCPSVPHCYDSNDEGMELTQALPLKLWDCYQGSPRVLMCKKNLVESLSNCTQNLSTLDTSCGMEFTQVLKRDMPLSGEKVYNPPLETQDRSTDCVQSTNRFSSLGKASSHMSDMSHQVYMSFDQNCSLSDQSSKSMEFTEAAPIKCLQLVTENRSPQTDNIQSLSMEFTVGIPYKPSITYDTKKRDSMGPPISGCSESFLLPSRTLPLQATKGHFDGDSMSNSVASHCNIPQSSTGPINTHDSTNQPSCQELSGSCSLNKPKDSLPHRLETANCHIPLTGSCVLDEKAFNLNGPLGITMSESIISQATAHASQQSVLVNLSPSEIFMNENSFYQMSPLDSDCDGPNNASLGENQSTEALHNYSSQLDSVEKNTKQNKSQCHPSDSLKDSFNQCESPELSSHSLEVHNSIEQLQCDTNKELPYGLEYCPFLNGPVGPDKNRQNPSEYPSKELLSNVCRPHSKSEEENTPEAILKHTSNFSFPFQNDMSQIDQGKIKISNAEAQHNDLVGDNCGLKPDAKLEESQQVLLVENCVPTSIEGKNMCKTEQLSETLSETLALADNKTCLELAASICFPDIDDNDLIEVSSKRGVTVAEDLDRRNENYILARPCAVRRESDATSSKYESARLFMLGLNLRRRYANVWYVKVLGKFLLLFVEVPSDNLNWEIQPLSVKLVETDYRQDDLVKYCISKVRCMFPSDWLERNCQTLFDLNRAIIKIKNEVSELRVFKKSLESLIYNYPTELTNETLCFYIVHLKSMLKFDIEIDISDWKNVNGSSIKVIQDIGTVRESLVKQLFNALKSDEKRFLTFLKFLNDPAKLV